MGRFPLILLALLSCANADYVEIRSPRVTNWGHTYDWSDCPNGMFAYGMQIKFEGDQRGKDDTGLNAVSLYCNHPNWNQYSKDNWIMSGEGGWGDWQEVKYCPEGTLIVGFALRSEPDQRGGDDVAADNFAAYCGTPDGPRNRDTWIAGHTAGWGSWTADQWCPQGLAVCGIRSQIEGDQRGGDDTALNNVDLKCCRAPGGFSGGSCTVQPELIRVHTYDNSQGGGSITAEFYKKIAFTRTTGSTETIGSQQKQSLYNKVSTGVTLSGQGIYKGVTMSGSTTVNYEHQASSETINTRELQLMVQDAMTHERSVKEVFTVPAWTKVVIEQLFLTCGNIQVSLSTTRTRSV